MNFDSELDGRLLALRHLLVLLISNLPDEQILDGLVQGADAAEGEERFARRAAAYRNEVDAVAVQARALRKIRK